MLKINVPSEMFRINLMMPIGECGCGKDDCPRSTKEKQNIYLQGMEVGLLRANTLLENPYILMSLKYKILAHTINIFSAIGIGATIFLGYYFL